VTVSALIDDNVDVLNPLNCDQTSVYELIVAPDENNLMFSLTVVAASFADFVNENVFKPFCIAVGASPLLILTGEIEGNVSILYC
jgi:hypothetical protein